MKYNIQQLYESNKLTEDFEDIEDIEDLMGYIGEAEATMGLDFFHITVDTDDPSINNWVINIPDNFNIPQAIDIINEYLELVENTSTPTSTSLQAIRYDKHTEPYRGADDGTFDYAGTYMLLILDALKNYTTK